MHKRKLICFMVLLLCAFLCLFRFREDERIADDLEMADVLLIKKIQHLDEYRHFLDDPNYEPKVGSNTIINFQNGEVTVKKGMDIAIYGLEADHMTLSDLISGYDRLSLIGKIKYRSVYERYKIYEKKYKIVIEGLIEVLGPDQNTPPAAVPDRNKNIE